MGVVQPSVLGYVASAFAYWRGSITFRIDIVKSGFHNGKIAVMYEPNHGQEVIISADVAFNKNFVEVIDIATTSSFEFTVEWASHLPWLRVFPPEDWESAQAIGPIVANNSEQINGFVNIYPFTALQSNDGSDIELNVFVRSENMVFNMLSAVNMPTSRYLVQTEGNVKFFETEGLHSELQTGMLTLRTAKSKAIDVLVVGRDVDQIKDIAHRPEFYYSPVTFVDGHGHNKKAQLVVERDSDWIDAVIVSNAGSYDFVTEAAYANHSDSEVLKFTLNESSATMDNCADYHFGELPLSFRPLLKRYVNQWWDVTTTAGSDYLAVYMFSPIYPSPVPAYDDETTAPNLYGLLRYAFLGMRGCMRKRYRSLAPGVIGYLHRCAVGLSDPGTSRAISVGTSINTSQLKQNGSASFVSATNGGIEVELPYYSPNLFVFSCADDNVGTQNTGEMALVWPQLAQFGAEIAGLAGDAINLVEEFATAEDFTFMRFIGAPYFTFDTPE
eukprot:NODE_226_length_1615_cov_216.134738_g160_i0.p1 GENE.NODE_226_length_1615_cov_216.134738_g160_i0~~NODE_226_length_1615_cov_216.134738_g160_i0.p1  ORF type:complete len:506 (-),score=-34.29 NODE_226_length_1615_cov_216.134738_g160_i0:98-1594(-)